MISRVYRSWTYPPRDGNHGRIENGEGHQVDTWKGPSSSRLKDKSESCAYPPAHVEHLLCARMVPVTREDTQGPRSS